MKFLGIVLLLAILVAFVAGSLATYYIYTPFGPSTETFVEIAPHTGTKAIATQLQQSGIIRNRYAFEFMKLTRGGTLKAGEYRFDHPIPMADVYSHIAHGEIYTRTLTIPEGYNIFDIAQAVEAAGLGDRNTFLAEERKHTELISEWTSGAAHPPDSLEGYLFPDTYHFARRTPAVHILAAMVRRFRLATQQLSLDSNVSRTVILASLVEKEVAQDSERPLVAGVFLNRLTKSIPLATDPTVIYAALLNNRWRGTIYASDLQSPSPYNTYKHSGLPPGPICNPGMAAFRAVLTPAKTDYLYFVSDAAGHSRFAATLKEHNQNVQSYRKSVQH